MSTNEKVTISFRVECPYDLTVISGIICELAYTGSVIKMCVELDKANINIVEPVVEIILPKSDLETFIDKVSEKDDLHVALDTMKQVPLSENNTERQYGRGQFTNRFG